MGTANKVHGTACFAMRERQDEFYMLKRNGVPIYQSIGRSRIHCFDFAMSIMHGDNAYRAMTEQLESEINAMGFEIVPVRVVEIGEE